MRSGQREGQGTEPVTPWLWLGKAYLSNVRTEWRAQADNGGGSLQYSSQGGKDRSREMQAAEL